MAESKPPALTAADINDFLDREFPQIHRGGRVFTVEAAEYGAARMRMSYHERFLRPGGTISGPAMFTLADLAMYAAVLSAIGPRAQAVTINLNMNFLRRPGPGDMIGEAKLLRLGRRLAMGEIGLHSDGVEELAAHATATYTIPPENEVK
jgi:uncharacterized protein (TIGR00369 family)